MAVAKNDSGTPSINGTGSSGTLSTLTVSAGSNLLLIVTVGYQAGRSVSSVTWNSVAMTSAGSVTNGAVYSEIFYLINPATGNQSVVATFSSSTDYTISAIAFSGADQSTGINAADTASATGSSTSPSKAITSSSDGATIAAENNNNNYVTTSTQTQIYVDSSGGLGGGSSYALAGSSNTHTWSSSSVNWVVIGVHVLAAAASSDPVASFVLHSPFMQFRAGRSA